MAGLHKHYVLQEHSLLLQSARLVVGVHKIVVFRVRVWGLRLGFRVGV
jgi:hypothetical protein